MSLFLVKLHSVTNAVLKDQRFYMDIGLLSYININCLFSTKLESGCSITIERILRNKDESFQPCSVQIKPVNTWEAPQKEFDGNIYVPKYIRTIQIFYFRDTIKVEYTHLPKENEIRKYPEDFL